MSLGDLIRNLREEKGLSQRQLAVSSGISNTEISRIESGERKQPSQETLHKLSKCLPISYEELLIAADYHIASAEAHNTTIQSLEQLKQKCPDLYYFWQSIRHRDDLRSLVKEASAFHPETINHLIGLLKLIEDKDKNR
ncbi:MAG: helix-turn-helix domain-containing protein [bacterium]|jgi:transcriptional regulator with XRE-family HTH domain